MYAVLHAGTRVLRGIVALQSGWCCIGDEEFVDLGDALPALLDVPMVLEQDITVRAATDEEIAAEQASSAAMTAPAPGPVDLALQHALTAIEALDISDGAKAAISELAKLLRGGS